MTLVIPFKLTGIESDESSSSNEIAADLGSLNVWARDGGASTGALIFLVSSSPTIPDTAADTLSTAPPVSLAV